MKKYLLLLLTSILSSNYMYSMSGELTEPEEMASIIEYYLQEIPTTPEDTLACALSEPCPKNDEIVAWLAGQKEIIRPCTDKCQLHNYNNILANNITQHGGPKNKNLGISESNYVFVMPNNPEYVFIIGSHNLRLGNLKQEHGCFCKQPDSTQLNNLINDYPTINTYQHISRYNCNKMFERAKSEKNLKSIFAPKVYLVPCPWIDYETRLADDTYIVAQQFVAGLKPVTTEFIRTMDYEKVRQLYAAVIFAGIWDIAGNMRVDSDGNIYIFEMQQQCKTSPKNFMLTLLGKDGRVDPLLDRREGVKALGGCFWNCPDQLQYLYEAIYNDSDLWFGNIIPKKYLARLITMAYAGACEVAAQINRTQR